jgi:hypothetical protein
MNLYSVYLWYRKAGRIENIENDKEDIINECKKLNILYKIYKWKEYKNEFTFIIFSKNKIVLEYLFNCHSHYIECSDTKLGLLYWYPKCCSNNIKKVLMKDSKNEELKYIFSNSKKSYLPFIINPFWANKLYFHVPCSLNCKETCAIAYSNLTIIKNILAKKKYNLFVSSFKWQFSFRWQHYYFK